MRISLRVVPSCHLVPLRSLPTACWRCRTLRASPKSDNGIGKGFKVIVLWGAVKPFSTIFSGGKESSWDFSSGLADFFKLPLREGPCRSNSLQSWQSAVVRPTTHSTNTNARLKHTVCRLTQFIPYSQSHWTHTRTHTSMWTVCIRQGIQKREKWQGLPWSQHRRKPFWSYRRQICRLC